MDDGEHLFDGLSVSESDSNFAGLTANLIRG